MPEEDGFRSSNRDSITPKVVKKISVIEGVDPLELHPPLYSVIEIDAVEDLFASAEKHPSQGTVRIEFDYNGCQVTIERDDEVNIRVKKTDKTA